MYGPIRVSVRSEAKRIGYGPLAEKLEISKGALWKFCNDLHYNPKNAHIRKALGLPEMITIEATRDEKGRFT